MGRYERLSLGNPIGSSAETVIGKLRVEPDDDGVGFVAWIIVGQGEIMLRNLGLHLVCPQNE